MAGLEGKVAFITGAARGKGVPMPSGWRKKEPTSWRWTSAGHWFPWTTQTPHEKNSMRPPLVEMRVARSSPSRPTSATWPALQRAFDEGMSSLGRVDIVVANAGIVRLTDGGDPAYVWGDIVATNLTGTWNTISVALPMLRGGGSEGHRDHHPRQDYEQRPASASATWPTRRLRPAWSAL